MNITKDQRIVVLSPSETRIAAIIGMERHFEIIKRALDRNGYALYSD